MDFVARSHGEPWAVWARNSLVRLALTELELGIRGAEGQRMAARIVERCDSPFHAGPLVALPRSADGVLILGWQHDGEAKAAGSLKAAGTARRAPARLREPK